MFKVVVLAGLFIKNVDDDVAVVKSYPATIAPTLLAKRLAPLELDEPFNLFGDRPNLSVVSTRHHD